MPKATITKTQAVFKRDQATFNAQANVIRFELDDEDTGMVSRTLVLNRKEVDDLGWPEEITVTIEPGDTLNGVSA